MKCTRCGEETTALSVCYTCRDDHGYPTPVKALQAPNYEEVCTVCGAVGCEHLRPPPTYPAQGRSKPQRGSSPRAFSDKDTSRMDIIYATQEAPTTLSKSIFLAGPSPRDGRRDSNPFTPGSQPGASTTSASSTIAALPLARPLGTAGWQLTDVRPISGPSWRLAPAAVFTPAGRQQQPTILAGMTGIEPARKG